MVYATSLHHESLGDATLHSFQCYSFLDLDLKISWERESDLQGRNLGSFEMSTEEWPLQIWTNTGLHCYGQLCSKISFPSYSSALVSFSICISQVLTKSLKYLLYLLISMFYSSYSLSSSHYLSSGFIFANQAISYFWISSDFFMEVLSYIPGKYTTSFSTSLISTEPVLFLIRMSPFF